MPASLYDITIYYRGIKQLDASGHWQFSRTSNYVSDFYHHMLYGYKPTKTTRICIHINETKNFEEPSFNGSICSIARSFNEDAFLNFSEIDKYKAILDLIHDCCLELSEKFEWKKEPFERAYLEIQQRNFSFLLDLPQKQSRDKKNIAHVQICKTENTLYSIFNFFMGESNETDKTL